MTMERTVSAEQKAVLKHEVEELKQQLLEAEGEKARLNETIRGEVDAGLKAKAQAMKEATEKDKQQADKIQEMQECSENEKKVLKGQISALEDTLTCKEAELLSGNQALTKSHGEIEKLKQDISNLNRIKTELESKVEAVQTSAQAKAAEIEQHHVGWTSLSGLLSQEEARPTPSPSCVQELYSVLSKTGKPQNSVHGSWWQDTPWLQGTIRALAQLQNAEVGSPRHSQGTERLKLVLNMNINNVAPGTPARQDFEASFLSDIAKSLKTPESRFTIASVTAGSVIVTTNISAATKPGEASASALRRKMSDMVLNPKSELYQGAVTCFVDGDRSARALTGLGMGELETVVTAVGPAYDTWSEFQYVDSEVPANTDGVTLGKEHIERCAGALSRREQHFVDLKADVAMGEVVLRAVAEMLSRASKERDMLDTQLRRTVYRAVGRAVLTWVEQLSRDAVRYLFVGWKGIIKEREMDELREQKKYSEKRIEEENAKRAKLKKQALKVQSDNKALQEEKQRLKVEEQAAMAATGRSLTLQSVTHMENFFQLARGFFLDEHSTSYNAYKKEHPEEPRRK